MLQINNFNRDLNQSITELIELLKYIHIYIENQHHIDDKARALIIKLFQHFNQHGELLLAKTITGQTFSGDLSENIETFGVYKYFNTCQKVESNFCKININGFTIIDGERRPRTFFLNNLIDRCVFILHEEREIDLCKNGCYIEYLEILNALTVLTDHYNLILNFL